MSDNNNCGDFRPTQDFPDFILDPRMSFQIISIIMRCYFNSIGLRFTRRDMRNEFIRYISFYLFPNSCVHILEFIRAGFYYSSYQDVVICYRCGYRRGNWQVTDNPNDIHRQFSPTCVLFRQQSTVNIQINDMFQFLREYLRQNPTGPINLPASSMRTEFSDRESQQTESYEIILPQADLPVPPINRPLEDIHYGIFEVRPALIRNQMIEIENRDQSQVHSELVNPLYGQSIPLSSEGCPALTYRNHSTNSETNFEQGYENSHATGDYSDSSQDTTELKTVFRQEIQSSEVVERNTNLSQYQRLIKRTSHASSELSSEGLQNGDVFPTEINRNMPSLENEGRSVTNVSSTADIGLEVENNNTVSAHALKANRTDLRKQPNKIQNSDLKIDTEDFDQVEEITEKNVPMPEAELHNERQKKPTNQEIETHREIQNRQRTENNQVTRADLETSEDSITTEFSISRRHTKSSVYMSRSNNGSSRNLAESSEQSVQQPGQSLASQNPSPRTVYSIKTKEKDRTGNEHSKTMKDVSVVSEVGNTKTILDDRKPSITFKSLPNKHTNASAPPVNQSKKCKSLEINGKQADLGPLTKKKMEMKREQTTMEEDPKKVSNRNLQTGTQAVNHEQINLQEEEIMGVKKFMSELEKNLMKIEDAKERETLMKELLEKSSM